MAKVLLKDVMKSFPGGAIAVNKVNVTCEEKEFLVLVGPSGCGKSTTLRMVAGLEELSGGEIWIDDTLVNDIPPKDRDIAMVFQNYALYPHMTVYENMAFGLKLRKYPKEEIKQRVMEAAEILGIQEMLDRKPKVFLFDEPLSNLDAKMRVQMRAEISKLHTRLQATMIYVTHDQVEAMTMGDRIVVMKDGIVQQVADPISLYDRPKNKFVAGFIGSPSMNFMEGTLTRRSNGLFFNEDNFQVKLTDEMASQLANYEGKEVALGMRPEDIYDKAYASNPSPDNTITATVEVVEPMGSEALIYLTTGKSPFVAKVDTHDQVEVNTDIELVFDMAKAHIFDATTGETIV